MGKRIFDSAREGESILGAGCLALSVPLYVAGLDFISSVSSDIYETVGKKLAGVGCLAAAAIIDLLPAKLIYDDIKLFKRYRKRNESKAIPEQPLSF